MLARSAKPNKQQTRTHTRTHRDTHTHTHTERHTHTHQCPTIEAAVLPVVRCCLVVDESTAPVISREQQAFLALALDEVRRGIQQLADPQAPYKTPDKTATAHTAILHDTAASGTASLTSTRCLEAAVVSRRLTAASRQTKHVTFLA